MREPESAPDIGWFNFPSAIFAYRCNEKKLATMWKSESSQSQLIKKPLLRLTTAAWIPIFLRPAFNAGLTRSLAIQKSPTN